MKPVLIASFCVLLASLTATACANQSANDSGANANLPALPTRAALQESVPPPRSNPNIRRLLQTMDEVSTWGHPDLFGEFAGMRRLFKGDYEGALEFFKLGARYADKLSQLSIGNMYLHGRGVSKDAATACAWLTLAAERGYPRYIAARDSVCARLSVGQHDKAVAVLHTLQSEYGDKAAKQRMKLALRSARNALTGSLLGHDAGVRTVSAASNPPNCGGYGLNIGGVEVPRRGCGRYDPKLWNPKKYFAARDAQWTGTVTVGELRKVNPPISGAEKKKPDDGH